MFGPTEEQSSRDLSNDCDKTGINTYTTVSESKTAFADRNIHSEKDYTNNCKTNHYINKTQSFVNSINSQVNRVTRLPPTKVKKRHAQHSFTLDAEQSTLFASKLRFAFSNKVRTAKRDLPFEKGFI